MSDTISTVVNGDIVTTITETKTINPDHSVTTMTTIDKTDHADEDNHTTSICETTTQDLDRKIIRQIEYYFSDVNLLRDRFLQNEMIKNDGWIPLSILITFKRLQSLTTDFQTIMNALQKSLSGLLELDQTENQIRRHPNRPIPISDSELQQLLKNRTVYVEGFPITSEVTLDKLFEFFEKYGSTDNIQMKRSKDKEFTGGVSVVFPTDETARQFVENSQQIPIKFHDGSILECSLKTDHSKSKSTAQRQEKQSIQTLTGALIHLIGMATDATRELIKEKFNPFTKMPWIDFNKGDTEAWVRLNEANTAKDVLEKVLAADDGKLIIGDREIISRVIEGEEETQFWKDANDKRITQRGKRKRNQSNGWNSSKRLKD